MVIIWKAACVPVYEFICRKDTGKILGSSGRQEIFFFVSVQTGYGIQLYSYPKANAGCLFEDKAEDA